MLITSDLLNSRTTSQDLVRAGGYNDCTHGWEGVSFEGGFDRGGHLGVGMDDLDCVEVWEDGEAVGESWEDC
jgi:hypothetical protein